MSEREQFTVIRQNIIEHFNHGELEALCFDLGQPYYRLPGSGTEEKAQALVAWCIRHGQIVQLLALLREARPKVDWSRGTAAQRPTSSLPTPNYPFPPNPNFTGREELLDQLHENLQVDTAVLTQVIAGLGGVGKTQLAREYCHRHGEAYDLISWLHADEETTLAASLIAWGRELGVAVDEAKEQKAQAEMVRRWLENSDLHWLLVLDNADHIEPNQAATYLPHAGKGRMLITSQNPNWRGKAQVLTLNVFAPGEAAAFLMERAGLETGTEIEAEAGRLAEALGWLPLALEHAGAYAEETGCTLSDYQRLFETQRQRLWQQAAAPDTYHAAITTTWQIAFEQVMAKNPVAIALLDLCCFLAPEDISLALLREHSEALPQELAALMADFLALNEAIGELRRYSLLERQGKMLSIHRLVQTVARDRMGEERAKIWVEAAVDLLMKAYRFDPHDMTTWPLCGQLLPHIQAVCFQAEKVQLYSLNESELNNEAGIYLLHFGNLAAAKPYFERTLAIDEKTLDPDHPFAAASLNNVGSLLQRMGDLAEAQPYYERALAIREKAFGPDHPETAGGLNNLGTLLKDMGDLTEARRHLERALLIFEKALGPDHPLTASSLNNLGDILRAMGDLAGARPHLERGLAIREKTLDPDHPHIANSLNNFGDLLKDMGDLTAVQPYLERALAIDEKAFGPDHPRTARSLKNLGSLLQEMGDLVGAQPHIERALAIREKALGPDHPDTAQSLNDLGGLLQAMGDLAGARPYYERSLAIYEDKLGLDHPTTKTVRGNLQSLL